MTANSSEVSNNYRTQSYPFADAIAILTADAKRRKFDSTVEVSCVLGLDPRKAEQAVRGSVALPHGTGKDVRVAVVAEGEIAAEATAAGADIVGFDELLEDIKNGKMDFDVLITHPSHMAAIGKLGPKLGPRGLMPNPKDGTVTPNVGSAVTSLKAGQVKFRNEKAGIVHAGIGKISFSSDKLKDNLEAVVAILYKMKPSQAKGTYFRKLWLSTTMGPGVQVDLSDLNY